MRALLALLTYRAAVLLSQVFDILDALDEVGTRYWIGGGWGVDALVGRQTRHHRDLDMAVDGAHLPWCLDTLVGMGYEVETDWLPVRVELVSHEGWVDLHPVEFDAAGNGIQAGLHGATFEYPVEALVNGELDGRLVPCLSAGLQIAFHTGYEPRSQDVHDLALLRSLDT